MKKKHNVKSDEAVADAQPVDYVVGQVCGSLFPKGSSGSGSLSALFSTAPAAAPLVFVPAPKPVLKSEEEREVPASKGPSIQSQQKSAKVKTPADDKVHKRENALQNADEDEQVKRVSKKAKRKAAERADGPEADDEEQRGAKRQRTAASRAEDRIKMKRTVFVGNLPTSCTKKTLQLFFRDMGAIESIRFRSVVRENPAMSRKLAAIQRKIHPKKQSINAYVVFKDEEGVSKALERNGVEIEKNFHIRVDRVSRNSAHDHKRSIFVGNLSFEISELALRQHFEDCGQVEAVRLVRDKDSGLGKGFGYVLFESADSVQLALKLDGSKLEGRAVRVKRSVKKEKVKKGDALGRGAKGRSTGRGPQKGPQGKEGKAKDPKPPQREKGSMDKGFKSTQGQKFAANRVNKIPGKSPKGSSSFKGEMVDPSKKTKKNKGLKKKRNAGKPVHI